MSELDILSIDSIIRKNFEEEFKKLPEHKEKLQEIEASLKNENFRRRVKVNLEKAKDDLVNCLGTIAKSGTEEFVKKMVLNDMKKSKNTTI